jgi:hypothetical protein
VAYSWELQVCVLEELYPKSLTDAHKKNPMAVITSIQRCLHTGSDEDAERRFFTNTIQYSIPSECMITSYDTEFRNLLHCCSRSSCILSVEELKQGQDLLVLITKNGVVRGRPRIVIYTDVFDIYLGFHRLFVTRSRTYL